LTGNRKHALIIHPEGNIFNNPTLCCLVSLLNEININVIVRSRSNYGQSNNVNNVNIKPYGKFIDFLRRLLFHKICCRYLIWLLVVAERLFLYKRQDFDIVIGVDSDGLIESGFHCLISRVPVIFFSFEIMFESETSSRYKNLEREASCYVRKWYVQDDVRAKLLHIENKLDLSRRVLLPLSSSGVGLSGNIRLRDKIGVPRDKKVALIMGSISSWSMTREIVQSVANWPNDWVLIIHDRYGRTLGELSALGIEPDDLVKEKIYLSCEYSSCIDDMGVVLAGVAIGLAFYRADYKTPCTGKNLEYIGLASGKISTFLRYGIPVILNEIGAYSELAIEHGFGVVVKDADDISIALSKCDCLAMSDAARIYFKEFLDFENYKNNLRDEFLSIIDAVE
jgi:glycosyltransferase involved in cell wall biosynthesis